ncbi:MAG: histidinol-phosphatase [Deltaproteobacteria bacterium]|nr:histidinol-phosphatase [Deltaproteobacteria bacterium]
MTYSTNFPHGTCWLRADFHLHTKADKEFSYSGEDDYYFSNYVDALKSAGISVGVITNHNKFDLEEFKSLRKTARKKEIFLLPGVELSVNDGANGIHTLIVFSDDWLANGQDYINQFLNIAFSGKTPDQYEKENCRSSLALIDTIKKLEDYHKDFFLVFAHVEDKSGLWHELDGGRLKEIGKNEFFRRRTLAFQKVRTHDVPDRKCRIKVQGWLDDVYPAEVEGSDPKSIDQIGRGKACYLKIGYFTFEAVKYALLDHEHRLADKPQKYIHSHIQSVFFDGGVLDGKTINLSPELNTLIGIRGSGKSSILEVIRYALDIPFGEKALDKEYKNRLVDHVLGSGGKVTVQAVDRRGQQYEIRRINREIPDVYIDGVLQPGISIRETIIHKPIYFGQKDLSATGEGFEKDLVEKLVGEKLAGIRSKIDAQRQKVAELVERLKKLAAIEDKKKEYEDKKRDAEFRLKFYKEHGMEEKLQKQVDFDTDSRKCLQILSFVRGYLDELESFITQYEDDLSNQRIYTSKQNKEFFEEFFAIYDQLIASFVNIREESAKGRKVLSELEKKAAEFEKLKESLKEQFAGIERKLAEQLRQSGAQAIRPDEFRMLRRTVEQATQMLEALSKQDFLRNRLKDELLAELAALNDLWREEYKLILTELEKVNSSRSSLEIKAEFKGDKSAYVAFMKDTFRGSRLREATFSALAEEFSDFGAMYKDFDNAKEKVGASAQTFEQYFTDNLAALLTWQVPNRFVIEYRGKELKHHSLGQRASALILFVLSQQENDVFIIDQPEDDLDNQTIYEDVIKLIRTLKPKTQFIFATHNANFPVLGDAEQIISCSYSDDFIQVKSGSIDCPKLQQEIVDIMEGGEEAFQQRKRRYEIWRSRNS